MGAHIFIHEITRSFQATGRDFAKRNDVSPYLIQLDCQKQTGDALMARMRLNSVLQSLGRNAKFEIPEWLQ